jgi:hypothetical protein
MSSSQHTACETADATALLRHIKIHHGSRAKGRALQALGHSVGTAKSCGVPAGVASSGLPVKAVICQRNAKALLAVKWWRGGPIYS